MSSPTEEEVDAAATELIPILNALLDSLDKDSGLDWPIPREDDTNWWPLDG